MSSRKGNSEAPYLFEQRGSGLRLAASDWGAAALPESHQVLHYGVQSLLIICGQEQWSICGQAGISHPPRFGNSMVTPSDKELNPITRYLNSLSEIHLSVKD